MTQFEYYSHNKMSQVKNDFTPALINELKSFLVERVVDNMSTEDLVQYVTDDLDDMYKNMSCLLYTSPSPRDLDLSRMPSSA